MQGAAGRRGVETLGHVPGTAGVLGRRLQVAPGQVQAHAIAPYQVERIGRVDVGAARAERHHQFDLVVQVTGRRRIRHRAAGGHHGIGRLGEEERRFAVRIAPHLARVRGIVAADAEHAAHRETAARTADGHRRRGGSGEDEF